jgi:hypothetical protein
MRSEPILGRLALGWLVYGLASFARSQAPPAVDGSDDGIRFTLSPRVCTLALNDKQCETQVHAAWQAAHDESLCLVILERPNVKRCWEHYSQGTYDIQLIFTEDVVFQLKDLDLQRVMASEVLRVIREAIRYRHRRREPWNIFD